jgi:hypothetical protein
LETAQLDLHLFTQLTKTKRMGLMLALGLPTRALHVSERWASSDISFSEIIYVWFVLSGLLSAKLND